MVQDEKSDVMQVGAAAAESPTLLPQCRSTALGVGLPASPFLQAISVNCLVIPESALGGDAAVRGSSIPQNTDATARSRR
jgi:hypothetical protein